MSTSTTTTSFASVLIFTVLLFVSSSSSSPLSRGTTTGHHAVAQQLWFSRENIQQRDKRNFHKKNQQHQFQSSSNNDERVNNVKKKFKPLKISRQWRKLDESQYTHPPPPPPPPPGTTTHHQQTIIDGGGNGSIEGTSNVDGEGNDAAGRVGGTSPPLSSNNEEKTFLMPALAIAAAAAVLTGGVIAGTFLRRGKQGERSLLQQRVKVVTESEHPGKEDKENSSESGMELPTPLQRSHPLMGIIARRIEECERTNSQSHDNKNHSSRRTPLPKNNLFNPPKNEAVMTNYALTLPDGSPVVVSA